MSSSFRISWRSLIALRTLSLAIRDDVEDLAQMFQRHGAGTTYFPVSPCNYSTCYLDFDCLSDQKRQDIYKWLAAPDPYANHFASRKKCQPRTGNWLLNSKKFEYWLSSSKPFLWLYGIRKLSIHDCF